MRTLTTGKVALTIAAALWLAGCQSNKNPSCSLDGGTELADTVGAPWPKFHADPANSGRLEVDLSATAISAELVIRGYCSGTTIQSCKDASDCPTQSPSQTCIAMGSISTTPIVGPPAGTEGLPSLYLASDDGNVYTVNPPETPDDPTDQMQVQGAILSTPLLGADGTLFVPSFGLLTQFKIDGTQKNASAIAGFAGAPNIWGLSPPMHDGTVYFATSAGTFTGICPNGIPRFSLTLPPSQAPVALTQDPNSPPDSPQPIIVAGGTNGQVRAFNIRGRRYWSFSASATIVAGILIDESTNLFYVADTSGRVFAASLTNGLADPDFSFAPAQSERPATITASPALGRDTAARPKLYIAGQSVAGQTPAQQRGVLYAVDRATGAVCWTFEAGGPITSSPAVATGGDHDVVVLAADTLVVLDPRVGPVAAGGRVYAIPDRDDDLCDGGPRCAPGDETCPVWVFDTASIDPPGHSYSFGAASPSIGSDGTVYIGRSGSRIATGSTDCPDRSVDPCVVNDGGALYAIHPDSDSALRLRDLRPHG